MLLFIENAIIVAKLINSHLFRSFFLFLYFSFKPVSNLFSVSLNYLFLARIIRCTVFRRLTFYRDNYSLGFFHNFRPQFLQHLSMIPRCFSFMGCFLPLVIHNCIFTRNVTVTFNLSSCSEFRDELPIPMKMSKLPTVDSPPNEGIFLGCSWMILLTSRNP